MIIFSIVMMVGGLLVLVIPFNAFERGSMTENNARTYSIFHIVGAKILSPIIFILGSSLLLMDKVNKSFLDIIFPIASFVTFIIAILIGVMSLFSQKINSFIWEHIFKFQKNSNLEGKLMAYGFLTLGVTLLACYTYLFWIDILFALDLIK